jgi:NTE family protein
VEAGEDGFQILFRQLVQQTIRAGFNAINLMLRSDQPLSVALGAGGIRGIAHIGVLEVLSERGFHIAEMTGTSVGAIITAFYAAVGMELPELRGLGLDLTSRHLLAWAWLRRMPDSVRRRYAHRAGIIPESLERLARASGKSLYHDVERLGLVCFDIRRQREVMFHNLMNDFPLEDAARGSASIPGFFPSRRCQANGETYRLVDGGVTNGLPVDHLLREPFRPVQILAVDVSSDERGRMRHLQKVNALHRQHPQIPIEFITPATIGKGTILSRSGELAQLIDAGRRAMEICLEAQSQG